MKICFAHGDVFDFGNRYGFCITILDTDTGTVVRKAIDCSHAKGVPTDVVDKGPVAEGALKMGLPPFTIVPAVMADNLRQLADWVEENE